MAQISSEFSAFINQFADAIVARVHQNFDATSSNELCGSTSIEPRMLTMVSKIFFHIIGDKLSAYVTTNNTFFHSKESGYFAVTIHVCFYSDNCSKGKMPLRS